MQYIKQQDKAGKIETNRLTGIEYRGSGPITEMLVHMGIMKI